MTYRIIVGVDGSTHSTAALRWAMDDATARNEAEVNAVLAWQMPSVSNSATFDYEELQRAYERLLTATVDEALPSPDLPVGLRVVMGDPAEVLVEASRNAELLVVGSRGRSPFAGLLLGSVSQACAARAACPVVAVKVADAENYRGAAAVSALRANLRVEPA